MRTNRQKTSTCFCKWYSEKCAAVPAACWAFRFFAWRSENSSCFRSCSADWNFRRQTFFSQVAGRERRILRKYNYWTTKSISKCFFRDEGKILWFSRKAMVEKEQSWQMCWRCCLGAKEVDETEEGAKTRRKGAACKPSWSDVCKTHCKPEHCNAFAFGYSDGSCYWVARTIQKKMRFWNQKRCEWKCFESVQIYANVHSTVRLQNGHMA